jgi:hypothetical protein
MLYLKPLFIFALARGISAQFSFPTSDCVDPAGTAQCIQTENNIQAVSCTQTCSQLQGEEYLYCLEGCACVSYSHYMNCILSGCWNKVCPAFPANHRV